MISKPKADYCPCYKYKGHFNFLGAKNKQITWSQNCKGRGAEDPPPVYSCLGSGSPCGPRQSPSPTPQPPHPQEKSSSLGPGESLGLYEARQTPEWWFWEPRATSQRLEAEANTGPGESLLEEGACSARSLPPLSPQSLPHPSLLAHGQARPALWGVPLPQGHTEVGGEAGLWPLGS